MFFQIPLLIAAVINLLPVYGILGSAQLSKLYGIPFEGNPDLEILMRHRAVLFGIVGTIVLYSMYDHMYRKVATFIALVSMVTFIVIAGLVGHYGTAIQNVIKVDIIGLIVLLPIVFFDQSMRFEKK